MFCISGLYIACKNCLEFHMHFIHALYNYTIWLFSSRSCLLSQVKTGNGSSNNTNATNGLSSEAAITEQSLRACGVVMSIGSNRASIMSSLAMSIMGWLPQPVRNVIEKWNNSSANEFPGLGAWVSIYIHSPEKTPSLM